jgi:Zn-dependent protease with chaperone function
MDSPKDLKYTLKLPETNVNVTPTSPLKEFLVMAAGLTGIVVAIYLLLGFSVDLIAPRLSPELEKKMAGPAMAMSIGEGRDRERSMATQQLLDRIQGRCEKLPYAFRIHVVPSPAVNALALPGGHIVIFTGLLERVGSENELAFVLAHEMGHYAHRDHLRGMGRRLVFVAMSAVLFGPDSRVGRLLGHGLNLTEMRFSRVQESRADEFALAALHCVYGHTAGATDFFEKIGRSSDPGTFGHYFATHPENRQRIAHIKALARAKDFFQGPKTPISPDLKPDPR